MNRYQYKTDNTDCQCDIVFLLQHAGYHAHNERQAQACFLVTNASLLALDKLLRYDVITPIDNGLEASQVELAAHFAPSNQFCMGDL